MRYALVILDFDGTLADSAAWFARELAAMARWYRFRQATPDDLQAMRREDSHAMLRRLGVARWKVPLIARSMRRRMGRDIAEIVLFSGVDRLITALDEAGVLLAIVTSNSESNVRQVLGAPLAARIDGYACGSSLFGKGAKIKKMVERLQVSEDVVLAIGDEVRDIDAAKEAGVSSGAVTWGYGEQSALEAQEPAWLFHTPDDIRAALMP